MQRLILLIFICICFNSTVHAQQPGMKVKKTSTVTQKVHNVFSRHKKYKGYKVKYTQDGHIVKRKEKFKKKDADD